MKKTAILFLFLIITLISCVKQTALPEPVNGYYPLDLSGLTEEEISKLHGWYKNDGIPEWSIINNKARVYVTFDNEISVSDAKKVLKLIKGSIPDQDNWPEFQNHILLTDIPIVNALTSLISLAKKETVRQITPGGNWPITDDV